VLGHRRRPRRPQRPSATERGGARRGGPAGLAAFVVGTNVAWAVAFDDEAAGASICHASRFPTIGRPASISPVSVPIAEPRKDGDQLGA